MYIAKSATEIHMIGEISFAFPVKSFNTTQEIIANIIPVAMEYAKGIITIARKPPIASATSPSKSILVTAESISQLQDRWLTENLRYQRIYNTDNLNLKNYDYVISSKDLTPEEIADKIYERYLDFIKNN